MADEKAEVDAQTRQIRQTIRKKTAKEFRQLAGEELFKPITRRLNEQAVQPGTTKPAEAEGPDYEMDSFDQLYPFDETFQPDTPTPPPSPPPPPPTPEEDDAEGFVFPPLPDFAEGAESVEKPQRARWEDVGLTKFLKKRMNQTNCEQSHLFSRK